MKSTLQRISMLLLIVTLLAACGGTPPAPSAPASEAPAPADAGPSDAPTTDDEASTTAERRVLRVAHEGLWGGAESLDPASPVVFYDAIRILYDTLARPDENYQPVPSLAAAWQANDDATAWLITLREGVTFHDGQPLTSADVAYTFERLLAPDAESTMSEVLRLIEQIETPDEQTVIFNLRQPHVELPVLLMHYGTSIIPADRGDTIGETGIGTGPFRLESLDALGTTRMVAHDDYWQGTPGVAAIELISIPEEDTRLQALQADQIDLLFELSPQQARTLEGNAELVVERYPAGTWHTIHMRTDTPPFDDPQVRKAMRLAADRQAMVDLIVQGEGTVSCDTLVWPGDPYRWDGDCPQNIEQAQQLLADAGYPDGLAVTLYTSDSFPAMIPMAEVYQQQAAAAGIDVTIEQVPADSYWTEIWGTVPLFIDIYPVEPADFVLNQNYRADSIYNATYYDNPELEELLDTARATPAQDARARIYREAQQLVADDGGSLVLFHSNELRAFRGTVAGIQLTGRYDMVWHTVTLSE